MQPHIACTNHMDGSSNLSTKEGVNMQKGEEKTLLRDAQPV
jgi:hypothetical protein